MKDKTKIKILKTIIAIGGICILIVFPGSIPVGLLIDNEFVVALIVYGAMILDGIAAVLIILLGWLWRDIKEPPAKAEKIPLPFCSYDETKKALHTSLNAYGYNKQGAILKDDQLTVMLYMKTFKSNEKDCFAIIRTSELTDMTLNIANDSITDILNEYYHGKITDKINMISVFCVDRLTPTLQKLLNNNIQQGYKNGRLPVAISFGGKNIYIAKQKDGFAITKYRRLRKQFFTILNNAQRISCALTIEE